MGKIQALEKGVSLLKWKGVNFLPKGKINPKTLGYIRPDGVINFQTAEAAETYAKNRCVAALHAPKPFERAILIEDSKIIGEVDGTRKNVQINNINLEGYNDVTLFHGHPINLPLSQQDYVSFIKDDKLKSIVAFNKHGEYSKMTKQNKPWVFRLLPNFFYDILKITRIDYSQTLCEELGKSDIADFNKNFSALFKKYKGLSKEEILATEEGMKLKEKAKKLLKKTNDIWAKNEKRFGIKYETNFSKLT